MFLQICGKAWQFAQTRHSIEDLDLVMAFSVRISDAFPNAIHKPTPKEEATAISTPLQSHRHVVCSMSFPSQARSDSGNRNHFRFLTNNLRTCSFSAPCTIMPCGQCRYSVRMPLSEHTVRSYEHLIDAQRLTVLIWITQDHNNFTFDDFTRPSGCISSAKSILVVGTHCLNSS